MKLIELHNMSTCITDEDDSYEQEKSSSEKSDLAKAIEGL